MKKRITKGILQAVGYIKRHSVVARAVCGLLALVVAIITLVMQQAGPTKADPNDLSAGDPDMPIIVRNTPPALDAMAARGPMASRAGGSDDPVVPNHGIPIDAAAVDYEIRRYEQYNDASWTSINVPNGNNVNNPYPTLSYSFDNRGMNGTTPFAQASNDEFPNGIFPEGTSGYFNTAVPVALPFPGLPTDIRDSRVPGAIPNTPEALIGTKTRDHVLFFPREMDMTDPIHPVVKTPSIIRFGGYNSPPWFDYIYTEQLDIASLEFDIVPRLWDFHTMKRTGFMFLCRRNVPPNELNPGTPKPPAAPVEKNGEEGFQYNADYTFSSVADFNNYVANSEYDASNGTISGYMFNIVALREDSNSVTDHNTFHGPQSGRINFELYYVQNMNIDAYNAYLKKYTQGSPQYAGQVTANSTTTGQTNNRLGSKTADISGTGTSTISGGQRNHFRPNNTRITPMSSNSPSTTDISSTWANRYGSNSTSEDLRNFGFYNPSRPTETLNTNPFQGTGAGFCLPRCTATPVNISKVASVTIPNYIFTNRQNTGTASRQGKMHFELKITDTNFEIWLTDVEGVRNQANPNNMDSQLNGGNPFLLFTDTYSSRPVTGKGFGLFMQNYSHNCPQLTVAEFQDFDLKKREPDQFNDATVEFFSLNLPESDPNAELRPVFSYYDATGQELKPGVDTYNVMPPSVLVSPHDGKTYYYFMSDRDGYEYDGTHTYNGVLHPDTGGSGLTDIPVFDDNANNNTKLYYIEGPAIEKHAQLMRRDGSGTFVAEGVDRDGLPLDPQKFEYNEHLQYTITLSNPNVVPLDGPAMQIVDVLPPGLKYVSSSTPLQTDPPGLDDGRQILVWDVYDIDPPNGVPANDGTSDGTVSVTVEVCVDPSGYGKTFVNGAELYAPDTGLEVTSNLVYHEALPFRLHVRQIVLGNVSSMDLPLMGYLQLVNDGQTLPATCFSGRDGTSVDFATYSFLLSDDPEYLVWLIVPQNFTYEGYLSSEDDNHVSATRILPPPAAGGVPNGEILLDYSNAGELWLTLYITQRGNPKDHFETYATNNFGILGQSSGTP